MIDYIIATATEISTTTTLFVYSVPVVGLVFIIFCFGVGVWTITATVKCVKN